jgi:hypothetical protein
LLTISFGKIFFRINHGIKFGTSNLAYEVQTRPAPHGGRLYEITFTPINTETQQPLTIAQLLNKFCLAPIKQEDLPEFLFNALSAVSLVSFRIGWGGKFSVRLPDYLEIAVRVKSLEIASEFLNIDNVAVRLRIDNPGRKETRNIYLQSGGVFHLAGIEHLASFTYGQNPVFAAAEGSKKKTGGTASIGSPVELAIRCTDTPLTLGSILRQFWPDAEVVPAPFNKVTNEVGLTQFRFSTGYSESHKKQVVQMVKIGVGVTKTEIEILGMLCSLCYRLVAPHST